MKDKFVKLLSSNLLLTLANLARDISIATFLGASADTDLFFLAISLPIFAITILSNAGRNVFLPLILQQNDTTDRLMVAQGVMQWVVKAVAAGMAMLLLPAALFWLFSQGQESLAWYNRLCLFLVVIVPMYGMAAVLELSQGPLQAFDRLFVPSALRLGLPLGLVVACFLLVDTMGVWSLVVGGSVATLLSMLLLAMQVRAAVFPAGFHSSALPAELSQKARAGILALILAYSISYVGPVVDQWMVGHVGDGAVSLLGYASRMIVGVSSLVAGTAAPIVLGFYCVRLGVDERHKVSSFYGHFIRIVPWLGGLATLLVWSFSEWMVSVLFQQGSLSPDQCRQIAELMDLYALQFPFFFASVAAYTLISAMDRNPFFIRLGVVMLLVKVVGNLVLLEWLGLKGIAASNVLVNLVSLLVMHHFIVQQGYHRYHFGDMLSLLVMVLVLAGVGLTPLFNLSKLSFHNLVASLPYFSSMLAAYAVIAFLVLLPVLRQIQASGNPDDPQQ